MQTILFFFYLADIMELELLNTLHNITGLKLQKEKIKPTGQHIILRISFFRKNMGHWATLILLSAVIDW